MGERLARVDVEGGGDATQVECWEIYRVHYTCEVTQSEQMLSEGPVGLTARDGYRYLALVDIEERVERSLHYPARVVRTCKAIYDERRWLW
jgi:hypothetical protein